MNNRQSNYYLPALIALATLAMYLPALRNDFVNWDDNLYVYENPNIRALDWTLIRWAFTNVYWSNWHPVTWLSHAMDYALWGLNPLGHHLTNILIHAVNTFLVVFLCVRLLEIGKMQTLGSERYSFLDTRGLIIAAGVTGLLFGLHPLHVESVAWVSERKDLLCALFFLLSILSYTNFIRTDGDASVSEGGAAIPIHSRSYMLSILFYGIALMSKPMAVSLPAVLLLLDGYPFQRMWTMKTLRRVCAEKIPFVALSLLLSIVTIMAQQGSIELNAHVPAWTRLLVAAKAYFIYLGKMIVPVGLLPYYSYPKQQTVSLLSPEYFMPVLLLSLITLYLIAAARKRKAWLSAWGYYAITLSPVSGIVQVGTQSMADRYTYLPSIGPFLIIGGIAAWVWAKAVLHPVARPLVIAAAVVMLLAMSLTTQKQIAVWKNSIALWSTVIQDDPRCDGIAYFNRGAALGTAGHFDRAIEDFSKVISLNPFTHLAYMNRGMAYSKVGRMEEAVSDYSRVISLKPDFIDAYIGRGDLHMRLGRTEQGIQDYQRACDMGSEAACNRVLSR